MNIADIKNIYFIGIGGIGMSALARYFRQLGKNVTGYDRTETTLTQELVKEGIAVHYTDDVALIDASVLNEPAGNTAVVFTPAVPIDHKELNYLKSNGYKIYKRAEILGLLTHETFTVAIGGTHGKTTTSCLTTHLLKRGGINCGAFLGGISVNYDTNFLLPETLVNGQYVTVAEADEYDRSFLQLSPDMAVITSMDADHLDIYGKHDELLESFHLFAGKIKPGGKLFIKKGLPLNQERVSAETFTYAVEKAADYTAKNFRIINRNYYYDLVTPQGTITDLRLGIPGLHNVENSVVASAIALQLGITEEKLRDGLETFKGVKRRFEYIIKSDDLVFIDDYAHHPAELDACIRSVRQIYPNKKITGIFQPHLYSRTRDFAKEFAKSLSQLDELILLDIYPARELPIEGITSEIILEDVSLKAKTLCSKSELITLMKGKNVEVLLTLGAGDIDQLVQPLKELYNG